MEGIEPWLPSRALNHPVPRGTPIALVEWDLHRILYIYTISDYLFYTASAWGPDGENMALGSQPHPPLAARVGTGAGNSSSSNSPVGGGQRLRQAISPSPLHLKATAELVRSPLLQEGSL